MLKDDQIWRQLPYCLGHTHFEGLGEYYEGKVRDNYTQDNRRILVVTDQLSAFDRLICKIPFKGQVLNQLAQFWFEATEDICPNHVIEFPDPNVVVAKQCKPLSVEMVVRDYITGSTSTSIWYNYHEKSVRDFCSNPLPEGLQKDQKLEKTIITPSTKAEKGDHDESVAPEVLIEREILTKKEWEHLADVSLKLFKRGSEIAAKQGIILVDTKYEFGKDEEGNIVLIDEIHTPDSSRFWIAETYESNLAQGKSPDNINKEFLRLWLADQGYRGDGQMPEITDEIRVETAKKYIEAYEKITGQIFRAEVCENLEERIKENLKNHFLC